MSADEKTTKALWMVALQARLILARYPFDDEDTMRLLYRALAGYLACLPDNPGGKGART